MTTFPYRNYEHIVKAHQNNPQQGENQVSDQIKFNIFQSIMDSLFQSFSNSVSVNSFQELSACVFSWIEEHCKPQVSSILYVLWINKTRRESSHVYVNITFWPEFCGSLLDTEGVCRWCAAAAQQSALLINSWTCLHKPDFGFALTSSSEPEASLLCSHWPCLITGMVSGIKSLPHWAAMENDHIELLHLLMTHFALSCSVLMTVPIWNAKESSCLLPNAGWSQSHSNCCPFETVTPSSCFHPFID